MSHRTRPPTTFPASIGRLNRLSLGTPVYMTEAAIEHFEKRGREAFQRDKARRRDQLADSVVWIPSSSTLITGDLVCNGVDAWLSPSDEDSRDAWRGAQLVERRT